MLDKLIADMKERGLMSVAPLRFQGKAKPVMDFICLMADTEPLRTPDATKRSN